MSATSTNSYRPNTEQNSVSIPVGAPMSDHVMIHHDATTTAGIQVPSKATATRPAQSLSDAYRAAILRARDEGLSAQRNADGTWTCKTYTVEFVGPRWSDLTCTCKGSNHKACKHRAIVIFGRKYGASRVAFKAKEVASPAIAESTPAEVAESAAIKAEVIAEMAEYPRGSRAEQAQCDATADYYEEVARANAAAYAAATTEAPSRDPLDDCYGTIAVETYMHAGYAA